MEEIERRMKKIQELRSKPGSTYPFLFKTIWNKQFEKLRVGKICRIIVIPVLCKFSLIWFELILDCTMQRTLQQLAGAALDSLGLSKIEDAQLLAHLHTLDSMEVSLR